VVIGSICGACDGRSAKNNEEFWPRSAIKCTQIFQYGQCLGVEYAVRIMYVALL